MLDVMGALQTTTVKQTVGPEPVPFPTGYVFRSWAIVALCSGEVETTYHVRLEMVSPSGNVAGTWRDEVRFLGGAQTHAIVFQDLSMPLEAPGLHWVDVYVRGRRLTRFPLQVLYQPLEPK